ncbi:3-hydroxyacyl-ACP dehydratase FabZ [Chrysiogenes arsenatis]|uniref:3-hydroxyacyl-ACP dehydratase FabZ n=1 Tax=Chrysiogenes arsenatis TaxID=309797 RepID=UPI00041D782B|nr:3-hydroxyacyl-ACP dehydratase FabZ [Chrysiogenes arsenatis]
MMNITEIMRYLPHRYPFLLVDRILELDEMHVLARKNVTINEQFFQGHFPGVPIMPGVLIIEAMAQAGGVLAIKTLENEGVDIRGKLIYFMTIDNAKFRRPVVPGDTLTFRITMENRKRNIMKQRGEAYVDDVLVCEAEFKAMVQESPTQG